MDFVVTILGGYQRWLIDARTVNGLSKTDLQGCPVRPWTPSIRMTHVRAREQVQDDLREQGPTVSFFWWEPLLIL